MIVEKALERMRRDSDARAAQPQQSASVTAARKRVAARPDAPPVSRPVFPRVEIDLACAEQHRLLMAHKGAGRKQDARCSAAYRMLRTRLLQTMRTNHWTNLAITSPGAGEGKTVTSINLASSLARDKSCSVFLLDLDLRNPSICRYLGVLPPHDLVSYFSGDGSPADAFFSIGVDNLAIAGGVTSTEQASELLASSRLEELLEYAASVTNAPIVLIDLPPLLITDEALLVAPRVDATLLVVGEGTTRRDSLVRAKHLLADFTLAGVVLNRTSESFGADSDYGYAHLYSDTSR
jgi:Mrp family chromosome partitioning ATPase